MSQGNHGTKMLSRMYLMMLLEFSHDLSRELGQYLGECEDGGGLVKPVDGHEQIEETDGAGGTPRASPKCERV